MMSAGVNHCHQHNSKRIIDVLSSMKGENERVSTLSEVDVHIRRLDAVAIRLPGKLVAYSYPAFLIGR